ncbi:hypothetical protein HPMBJEAJ_00391 [Aeromonas phage avDM6]|nr:hypothetical protein HPMBJEAJ_00391 [Aeromonas phage avDM6]
MENTVTLAVVLDPISGDVTNWMQSRYSDKSSVDCLISKLEHQYNKPVEVYHFRNCYPGGLIESWGLCTREQKTDWINRNLINMVYSTQEGFTEYGKSVIVEPIFDDEE